MSDSGRAHETKAADPQALAKAATGIRGLDDVLDGGLPAGRTTLLSGGPGTGKTVLALEFLVRGAMAGRPGIFVSFEERAEAVRANAATLGWDLAALEDSGRLNVVHAAPPVRSVRSGDFDIQGLLAVLGAQVEALGAGRIVLDAVDQLFRTFEDPERERNELHHLHEWLLERGLTAILTLKAQPGGDLVYPFLGFLADCMIHLDQRMESQVRIRRLQVVKFRGSSFLSNEYPYLISSRGVVVMPVSMVALGEIDRDDRVSSGHPALDEVLGGGYREGSTVLVSGPTGVGKTTLASLFACAACGRGEPVLYVSFEEAAGTLVAGMHSAGIDLGPHLERGLLRIVSTMPEAKGTEEHLFDVLTAVEEIGARHIVVDAVSACHRLGSEAAAFDFMVRLVSETKPLGVTCLLTDQTANQSMAHEISSIGVSSLIDTIVALEYVTEEHGLRRRLLVLKSRASRHSNRFHWLEITDDGIALSSTAAETGPLSTGDLPPRGSRG
ncbi:MAG TPA: circadian clock protein KaiC [Candidatus Sulfomarinibacteraceae bacterium]|nr:circadian clock protein KaiC [Candidatus Sulfomarinibacteraceae bacterium]